MPNAINAHYYSKYVKAIVSGLLFLLVILIAFQSLTLYTGTGSSIIYQIATQRIRAVRIKADALILLYRPLSEHAQAYNELQSIVPSFEHIQNSLLNGDTSLGIPAPNSDTYLQLQTAQSDFIALDTSAKYIISSQDIALQVDIIVAHETGYARSMSVATILWLNNVDSNYRDIVCIKLGITLAAVIIIVWGNISVTRKYVGRLLKEEEGG